MPETTIEIRVSFREADRPRLLQVVARDGDGAACVGLSLRLLIDANGTFEEEGERTEREVSTGRDGAALFQWWEWPRDGERRSFASVVRVVWEAEDAFVYIEDLYE